MTEERDRKKTKIESEKKQRKMAGPQAGGRTSFNKDEIELVIMGESGKEKIGTLSNGKIEFKSKGGRAGYRMGGKCKLATKGKGRAYGKNS